MIKKLWKIICWPWTKYVEWLGTGLPEKKRWTIDFVKSVITYVIV